MLALRPVVRVHAAACAQTRLLTTTRPRTFELREELHPDNEAAPSPNTFAVTNPATGALLANVPDMSRHNTADAVQRALAALPAWSARTAKDRAAVLREWHRLLMENQEYLGGLITAEMGKPLAEAKGEVAYGASFISWFAEQGLRVCGDTMPVMAPNQRILVLKQPVGVCAAVTPWNFPLAMLTRKAGAALAAGCTMVVKPAEDTPLTAQAMLELAFQAGVPRDALPLVTCGRAGVADVGEELCTNPAVAKVSFTGSTAVGKHLAAQAAGTVKRVSLELGGNAPFVVFADADLDAAVAGAMASKFRASGQTCVCTNRIFVQDEVHDEFVERFTAAVSSLVVGDGADPATTQGPLINEAAVKKVSALVADATEKGASVAVGGSQADLGPNFFQPTVLTDVTPSMDVCSSEIFGPVAPVLRFTNEANAISMANDTRAGLVSYVYSRDIGRVWRVAEALQTGMVGVNTGIISTEVAPFGGVKESGIGREGSIYGLDEYMNHKYICLDLGEQA